ncbi:hypothetical protein GCM10011374_30170 [Kocuria dechangensis]|uniref:Helix-turn-helix domain-containing protein n=1 Tax=Kocuria dechangensis TaxID=1176249 RepID=A0A917H114_9MICC|nr:hypothetical protein GCM10011374_30170 [Kocuria dechangensis]
MSQLPDHFRVFKPQEVAAAIRMLPESTLRKMAREGKIPFHLGPKNSVWFTLDDIEEILRTFHQPVRTNESLEQLVGDSQEVNPFRTTSRSSSTRRIRAKA